MRWLTICCLLLLTPLLSRCDGENPSAKYNLVLICLDTVRFDAFFLPERAGLEDPLSEYLEQGVVFTKAQAAAPWTVPSVASTLTGLYPAQHGAGRFAQPVANLDQDMPSALREQVTTLAERLGFHGFSSVLVTSHPWLKGGYGLEQGFGQIKERKDDVKLTQAAVGWLQSKLQKPFFLYLHLMDAHAWHKRVEQSEKFLAPAAPGLLETIRRYAPRSACDKAGSRMCRGWQVYMLDTLAQRRQVARLLDSLRTQGLMESTLVVLYADHGEEFHDHLNVEKRWKADPRGFFGVGHGQSLFQELLHVPLVVWHPGLPGQAADQVVSLVDITPSILNWLGLGIEDEEFSGRPIEELGEGDTTPFAWSDYSPEHWPDMERKLFASGIAYGPEQIAVLTDGWKYIWHAATGKSYLYNLKQDPDENNPVVNEQIITRLEPALDRYFTWLNTGSALPAELSEEQLQELKGVGYLQGVEQDSQTEEDRKQNL